MDDKEFLYFKPFLATSLSNFGNNADYDLIFYKCVECNQKRKEVGIDSWLTPQSMAVCGSCTQKHSGLNYEEFDQIARKIISEQEKVKAQFQVSEKAFEILSAREIEIHFPYVVAFSSEASSILSKLGKMHLLQSRECICVVDPNP